MGVAVSLSVYERQQDRTQAMQNEVVGDTLMHSQRLAKAANMAVRGNVLAYGQLTSSRDYLSGAVSALENGGDVGRFHVPPLPEKLDAEARRFGTAWADVSPSVDSLIEYQPVLVRFAELVNEISAVDRDLRAAQHAAAASLREGSSSCLRNSAASVAPSWGKSCACTATAPMTGVMPWRWPMPSRILPSRWKRR